MQIKSWFERNILFWIGWRVFKTCNRLQIILPMNSRFRPHNLRKLRPTGVPPRTELRVVQPPR